MTTTKKRRTKAINNNVKNQEQEQDAVRSNRPSHSYCLIFTLLIGILVTTYTIYWTLVHNSQPSSINRPDLPLPSATLIKQAQTYCYAGNMAALVQLINSHDRVDWVRIQEYKTPTDTLIHIALNGRHESVSSSSATPLDGNHEGIIEYLVKDLGWNASYGCPAYFALHYKNLKALKVLLSHSSLYCVMTTDTMGLTALHVAAKSKASGFARFYSKLFNGKGIVKQPPTEAVAVLGISQKVPNQPIPGSLSMKALNNAILHEDITLILNLLSVNNVKLSEILDSLNNTVTHVAAYAGRKKLVKTLLEYITATGDDEQVRNTFGQTPQQLAELGGYTDIVKLFNEPLLSSVKEKFVEINKKLIVDVQQANWNRYLLSGWTANMESLDSVSKAYPLCSEMLPVVRELTQHTMSQRTPLLILSDEMRNWKALNKWRKRDLVDRYGGIMFNVASIPYEDTYLSSLTLSTTRLSLQQYIDSFNITHHRPLYLFDGNILNQLPQLMEDISIPHWINPSSIYLRQFILGGARSGSPPHFHDNAVNGLVYGLKEWFFWRPSRSFFTFSHVSDWKDKYYHDHEPPDVHCVQLPGDMVYVPQYWGHAVVNVEESIGVALEFW